MLFIYFGTAFACGLLITSFFLHFYQKHHLQKAKEESDQILGEAHEQLELQNMERKELIRELENSAWSRKEKELQAMEEKIKQLQFALHEKRHQYKRFWQQKKRPLFHQQNNVERKKRKVRDSKKRIEQLESQLAQSRREYTEKLQSILPDAMEKIREAIQLEQEKKILVQVKKSSLELEEKSKAEAKTKAKQLMDIAFSRFKRRCSTEKGILFPSLKSKKIQEMLLAEKSPYRDALEENCKCQLKVEVEKESQQLQVSTYDPVRKELVRRCLRHLNKLSKNNVFPLSSVETITEMVKKQKKQLLTDIAADGKKVAKELKQAPFHKEILKMLGCLRYRYSFTQNQYFHVGEVGWLCGLIASELGLNVHAARRTGLLHDIGKSLTHAMEGSHAVIGADFIRERSEKEEICHPVRAHHNDETPSTCLAFLVIAADAISGGRPGARRAAAESYSEKVSALEDIALRHKGVESCYVLNGGREMRIFSNSEIVNDEETIALSRDIAQALQRERHIPSKIKVVVTRKKTLQVLTQEKKAVKAAYY